MTGTGPGTETGIETATPVAGSDEPETADPGGSNSGVPADEDGGWAKLDPRMLAVGPATDLVRLIPLLLFAVVAGGDRGRPWLLLGVLAVATGTGVLRWLTTRYRVSERLVEVRSGLVFRQHRSVPRDRVRTVDVTAGPLHRLFRLAVLKVGTGQQEVNGERGLSLNAVSAAQSEQLRRQLLDRSAGAPAAVAPDRADQAGPDAGTRPAPAAEELSRLSLAWLRFAPLTLFGLVAVGAVAGAGWQLANEAGVDVYDLRLIRRVMDALADSPLWLSVSVPVLSLLAVGALGSLVVYVEGWWRYRLTRPADGTIRVNRGLLTSRSISLEERRLRGVELVEPLLLRAGRGARCDAVAAGSGSTGRAGILPPAPRAEAHRVAAAVLREPDSPTSTRLARHPAAALRRRLVRTLVPAGAVVAVLAGITGWQQPASGSWWWPWWWLVAAIVLLPAAALLGVDRYRSLGHALTDRHLVARQGSTSRRTVALRRDGIIGWRVSQSLFQRRAGLATVTATTAAGAGAVQVLDVDLSGGLRMADAATPGLLTGFLAG